MAYPTPEGIGEAAVGSGMAAIQFMLAAQMELLKEYEEASRVWMSEVKLWSKLAVKSSTRVAAGRAGGPGSLVSQTFERNLGPHSWPVALVVESEKSECASGEARG